MKYFLINETHRPATIEDACRVLAEFKEWNIPATVRHAEGGFCVDTDEIDIRSWLPAGITCVPLKYEHVKGFVTRANSNILAGLIKHWGGKVCTLSEAFEDSYIEADVLDDGFFNEYVKAILF